MNNRYKIKTSILTTKEQIKILKEDLKLSFTKIKATGHKKAIFLVGKLYINGKVKKNMYISNDLDSHCGGTWKVAESLENIFSKKKRYGTFTWDFKDKVSD